MKPYYKTTNGTIMLGDSLEYMASLGAESLDLIMTSPPLGLVRKKDYGNVESHEYVDWFKQFAAEFKRLLERFRFRCLHIRKRRRSLNTRLASRH